MVGLAKIEPIGIQKGYRLVDEFNIDRFRRYHEHDDETIVSHEMHAQCLYKNTT